MKENKLSKLNERQRITVSATLSMIALHGHNPRPVQQAAQKHIATGMAPNKAYSAALEAFAGKVPGIRETLSTVIALISNSDSETLAKYDAALTEFNNTGDNTALENLGPMIAEDVKALLIRDGQLTPEEAATINWDAREALALEQSAVPAEPWQPSAEEFAAPAAQPSNEGNEMSPLTPREYAAAVRELQRANKGPVEGTPEYSELQARLSGSYQNGSATSAQGNPMGTVPTYMPKAEMRDGQPYIPAYKTATGYRGAVTGDQARRLSSEALPSNAPAA